MNIMRPKTSNCAYCRAFYIQTHSKVKYCSDNCRFWGRLPRGNKESCWEWVGSKTSAGYGTFGLSLNSQEKTTVLAHRFSYQITNGPIPKNMYVCHKCDNPSCCNPEHLFLGTPLDNVEDMIEKGRHGLKGTRFTEEHRKKLSEAKKGKKPNLSLENRRNKSDIMKNRWKNPEWREHFSKIMSGDNNPSRIAAMIRDGYES